MRSESQLVASGFGWRQAQGEEAGVQQERAILSYPDLLAQRTKSSHGRLGVATCLVSAGRRELKSTETEE